MSTVCSVQGLFTVVYPNRPLFPYTLCTHAKVQYASTWPECSMYIFLRGTQHIHPTVYVFPWVLHVLYIYTPESTTVHKSYRTVYFHPWVQHVYIYLWVNITSCVWPSVFTFVCMCVCLLCVWETELLCVWVFVWVSGRQSSCMRACVACVRVLRACVLVCVRACMKVYLTSSSSLLDPRSSCSSFTRKDKDLDRNRKLVIQSCVLKPCCQNTSPKTVQPNQRLFLPRSSDSANQKATFVKAWSN
jgi:hypothetical protein